MPLLVLTALKGFTLVGTGAENLRLNYTFKNNDVPRDGPVSKDPELFGKVGPPLHTYFSI